MRRRLMCYGTVLLILFLIWFYERPEPETKQLPLINRTPIEKEQPSDNVKCEIKAFNEYSVQAKVETHIYCVWLETDISREDYELLCTTTFCEAGNQDLETQVMVCLTILNRFGSDLFQDSIREVIYAKGAYAVTNWKNFENYGWTEQVEEAVNIALSENNHPRDMYYFRTLHYHKFGKPYMQSDDLWFSTRD